MLQGVSIWIFYRQLSATVIRGVSHSMHCWYGKSLIREVVDSLYWWYRESSTLRIVDTGSHWLCIFVIREVVKLIFLYISVRHRSLTHMLRPFRFWLRIRGNRKSTPRIGDCAESARYPWLILVFKTLNKPSETVLYSTPLVDFLLYCPFKGMGCPSNFLKINSS